MDPASCGVFFLRRPPPTGQSIHSRLRRSVKCTRMDIELIEIREFIGAHHPFDQLPETMLVELPARLEVRYFRRESSIPNIGSLDNHLYIVRSGAVELHGSDDELYGPGEELHARLGEGDVFGYRASYRHSQGSYTASALEDTLIYQIP